MSDGLMRVIQDFLVTDKQGVGKLALAVDKHQGTVQRWINQRRIPDANDRYLIALACGQTEKQAIALARDAAPSKAMAG